MVALANFSTACPSRLPVFGHLADGKSGMTCRCLLLEREAKIAQFLGVSTPGKRNGLLLRNHGTAVAEKVREEVVQPATGEDDGEAHAASPKPHRRGCDLGVSLIGSPLCRSPLSPIPHPCWKDCGVLSAKDSDIAVARFSDFKLSTAARLITTAANTCDYASSG